MHTVEDIKTLFELAGVAHDFCITKLSEDTIVCGGWNRVFLYSDGTAKLSTHHCTEEFIAVGEKLGFTIL